MESNFGVAKVLAPRLAHKIVYSMKLSLGSGVLQWSQILEWQKYLPFPHKTMYSMEWNL